MAGSSKSESKSDFEDLGGRKVGSWKKVLGDGFKGGVFGGGEEEWKWVRWGG